MLVLMRFILKCCVIISFTLADMAFLTLRVFSAPCSFAIIRAIAQSTLFISLKMQHRPNQTLQGH